MSGFGQNGPSAARGGFDLVAQGMSGIMSVTGEAGLPPMKCGLPITDLGAGLFATYAILAAYAHRLRTGEGQHIDTSLLRSEEHTSELQSQSNLVCRLLLEKKKTTMVSNILDHVIPTRF